MAVPQCGMAKRRQWPRHGAAAVLHIIRYREMRVRFTMRKAWSCDRKGAGCGRKAVGLLRRRVGMEVQRGCLTCKMSAVFTPPWGFRMTYAPYGGQNGRCLVPHCHRFSTFSICFRCAHTRFPSVSVAVLWSFAVCFLVCSSIDCCLQIYGFVTLCPNKFG